MQKSHSVPYQFHTNNVRFRDALNDLRGFSCGPAEALLQQDLGTKKAPKRDA